MNLNWIGLSAVALAVMAFFVSYRIWIGWSLKRKLVLLVITTLLALPGLSFAFYYTHILPESAGYYQFRSIRFVEFCLVPIGIAGGVFAAIIPRVLLLVPLIGVLLVTFVPFLKPIINPLQVDMSDETWVDGLCHQTTASTCGPASLATVLKSLDVDSREAELAEESYTYAYGTEAWYLARAARKRGVDVRFRFYEENEIDRVEMPAIIGVKLGPIGHFVTLLEKDGDRLLIGDPLGSKEWQTKDQFNKVYTSFTGFSMEISREVPNDN